jgi:hypothetical protein
LNANIKNIIETALFKAAIEYFFEFDLNNLYQKLFEQLITLLSNKFTCKLLIDHIFVELALLDDIINKVETRLFYTFKK